VQIPAENSPSKIFARLFLNGTAEEVQGQVRRLQQGQSILDTVREHARRLNRVVPAGDREKLDQYYTSVRQLESDLARAQEWSRTPKPEVAAPPPEDSTNPADIVGRTQLMYDLASLALSTDSTRLITLHLSGDGVPPIEGVREGHHVLSHHGNNPDKLAQIGRIQSQLMGALNRLLSRLQQTGEEDQTLLDRTMVLYGSNLGNANNHSTRNMPMLLAGGGFRHGQHLAFDRHDNYPLPNLYVSMLQRLGVETDRFASSTGAMTGLEML
jgi:hypothetical protein